MAVHLPARLAVDELVVGQGSWILPALSLDVAPAEIVAIVGPSGSGKSSLLATVVGALAARAGVIRVDDVDVTTAPIHRRRVGMIFQEPLLFPHLDVADNVAYGLRRHGVARADARERSRTALAWVGLADLADRRVDALSGGQAQRVALARALAPRPAVLLLDEPFSALDADLRERLAADVAATLREDGMAAVHVTHDVDEARAMADRVVRLDPDDPRVLVPVT